MDLVGLVLGNSTQRRVDHPACARVLAMHRGVGGVLGPFTCGFRAGEDGERVGVSETGVAAAGKVSRAARWQRLSAEWHGCGWPVPAWRWRSGKRRVWQRHAWRRRCGSSRGRVIGGHDSGGCGIGGHDAVEQPSGCVAAAAVWQRQQCGIGGPVASAWQYQYGGGIAVARQQECDIVSVGRSSRGGPMWRERFGSSGVAAAVDGSSGAGPAVGDQSEGRACVRAGAQTWRAHLRGHQRGRGGRASGRWRTSFEFTMCMSLR